MFKAVLAGEMPTRRHSRIFIPRIGSGAEDMAPGCPMPAPGRLLTISGDRVETRTYWDLSYDSGSGSGSESQIPAILHDAVDRHLLADVPVGVFSAVEWTRPASRVWPRASGAHRCRHSLWYSTRKNYRSGRSERAGPGFRHRPSRDSGYGSRFPARTSGIFGRGGSADGRRSQHLLCFPWPPAELGLKVVLSGVGGDECVFRISSLSGFDCGKRSAGRLRALPLRHSTDSRDKGASLFAGMGGAEKWQRFQYCDGRSLDESLYLLVRGFFPPARVRRLLGTTKSWSAILWSRASRRSGFLVKTEFHHPAVFTTLR